MFANVEVPDAVTVAAMEAARRGELVTVGSPEDLLASLNEKVSTRPVDFDDGRNDDVRVGKEELIRVCGALAMFAEFGKDVLVGGPTGFASYL